MGAFHCIEHALTLGACRLWPPFAPSMPHRSVIYEPAAWAATTQSLVARPNEYFTQREVDRDGARRFSWTEPAHRGLQGGGRTIQPPSLSSEANFNPREISNHSQDGWERKCQGMSNGNKRDKLGKMGANVVPYAAWGTMPPSDVIIKGRYATADYYI